MRGQGTGDRGQGTGVRGQETGVRRSNPERPAPLPQPPPDPCPLSPVPSRPGRILGLDVGGKRTGVAVSDELGFLASPIGLVTRGPRDRADFRALIARYGVDRLVAGLPTGLSGREGPQAADVRAYADALAADLALPLAYWDERLTTAIAERSLIAAGRSRDQRRDEIDAVAAAVMLQGYLDHARRRRGQGTGDRGQGTGD